MPTRKHFDAIGWGTGIVIALGDALSNAVGGYAVINATDTNHVMTAAMWEGLLVLLAFTTLKTVAAAMKNFGQYITTEEVGASVATFPSGAQVVTESKKTTTMPVDDPPAGAA